MNGVNKRVTVVSGKVCEAGRSLFETGWSKYTFFTVCKDDGSLVRVNNATVSSDSAVEIEKYRQATFYIRRVREPGTKTGYSNVVIATESDRGQFFHITPTAGLIASFAFKLLLLSPFLYGIGWFALSYPVYAFFGTTPALFTAGIPVLLCVIALWFMIRMRGDAVKQRKAILRADGNFYGAPIVQNI
ncbi:hypothetical protein [Endobacterium cereale]|uniref:hypothetical protein n=1 Tax=Endobacterium cereale TaxID=2663029 RepID=UPI002B497820|nr:hypothetical protein [Endobacterium cereale]MEB2846817.1 hypothetical protein [Endobacterium cereale]